MVNKKQVDDAPQTPGVYFFYDRGGKIIYIGKAQNLKMRLASYFRKEEVDARKRAMLEETAGINWRELSSDIEALIKEAELIKKHCPKYNILMRDDKQYFYVALTKEEFPKILITHQPKSGQGVHFGPFTDGWAIKAVLKTLRKSFPYCQCNIKSKLRHSRPCQQANIGRCLGVCCLKEKERPRFYPKALKLVKKYKENIKTIKKILSGKYAAVIKDTLRAMEKASAEKKYELAAELRDEIKALENIFEHRPFLARDDYSWRQKALGYLKIALGLKNVRRIEFFDVSNFQGKLAVGSMVVFTEGAADKNEYRKFRIKLPEKPDDTAMIKEIIERRLEHENWPKPDLIIVDGGKSQLNAALDAKLQITDYKLQIAALAKREEEFYLPDRRVIKLKNGPEPLLHLLQAIRNEAHRFAIAYHKKLRSNQITKIKSAY